KLVAQLEIVVTRRIVALPSRQISIIRIAGRSETDPRIHHGFRKRQVAPIDSQRSDTGARQSAEDVRYLIPMFGRLGALAAMSGEQVTIGGRLKRRIGAGDAASPVGKLGVAKKKCALLNDVVVAADGILFERQF